MLVPRNGLGNRLQAWASSAILAAELDVPLKILWEPETPAPADAADLFDASLITRTFVDRPVVDDLLGGPHESLPRYLWVDDMRRVIVLAGHDRGEQVFMPALLEALEHPCRPHTLVIIAGGLFHLGSGTALVRQRGAFYRSLHWNPIVESMVRAQSASRMPYCALHIRQTDRSVEAPPAATIRAGLATLAERTSARSLFIAADTAEGRARWERESRALGFSPWTADATEFDRTLAQGTLSAAVDWLLLAQSVGIAYPAASTFSAEASVASGHLDSAVPMAATAGRQRARVAGGHLRAALTYPARHWGPSRGERA